MAWSPISDLTGPQGEQGPAGSDADVTAHEAAADPHPQYHNDARGDGRYYTQTMADDLLGQKANDIHQHSAGNISSGTLDPDRIPFGTSFDSVSRGDHDHDADYSATGHTHTAGDVNAGTFVIGRIPTGATSNTVALGNHGHDPMDLIGDSEMYSRFHSTTAQTISSVSDTFVSFPTTAHNAAGVTRTASGAGHFFTVNTAGIWVFTAVIRYDPGGAGECYGEFQTSNLGSQQTVSASGGYSNGGAHTINLSYIGYFSSSNWILVRTFQATGGSRSLAGTTGWRNINMALIRRC